ncbi:MAG TPA: carboxypeptidase-like regulatory domain-containing protein [Gemmatimonadaceae bacterium]|jgi:hypothetical protein
MKEKIFALVVFAVGSSSLQSQAASAPSPVSSVSGTAVDSLHGGYLRDAVVRVVGTSRASATDSLGRFRIDSVPPGSHQLELIHPLLDTLGISVKTEPVSFKPGESASAALATPSPSTVIGRKCTAAELRLGPAAAVGMVLEADTDAPAVGARISLEWIDIEAVGKDFTRSPKRRIATVQTDGSFRICGLPEDFSANAVAYRAADSTSVVGVRFAPLLAIVTLFLPSPSAAAASAGATLKGRVVGPDDTPISRARIAVEDERLAALTGDDGAFALQGIRPGTRAVSVRALGFQPTETVVALRSGAPREMKLRLEKFVPVLKSVVVSAVRDASLERVGFSERKSAGSGKFFSPDEIDQRNPQKLDHLLETVSVLRSHRTATGQTYITGRGNGCVQYYVDGVRWASAASFSTMGTQSSPLEDPSQASPDGFISGGELGAVEIYDALSAPAEFASESRGGQPCSIVLIWTKAKLGIR